MGQNIKNGSGEDATMEGLLSFFRGQMKKTVIILLVLMFAGFLLTSCQKTKEHEGKKEVQAQKEELKQQPSERSDASFYHSEGLRLFYENKYEEAKEVWLKELALTPNNPNTMRNIGIAYANLKDYKSAKKWYHKALKVSSNSVAARNSLALVLFWEKNYSGCEKEFKEVIRLSPSYQYAHFNLGNCYSPQRKYTLAIDEFIEHLKQYPDDYSAASNIFNIVDSLSRQKKYGKASEALLKFSKIPTKFPESHKNIYNVPNKLLSMYQSALLRQDYPQITKGLRGLMKHLSPNDDLWISLNKMLAYSYLAIGDKANSIRTIKKLIGSKSLKIDILALKALINDLTKKKDKDILTAQKGNLTLMINEYNLNVKSDINIVDYFGDLPFSEDSLLSTEMHRGRVSSKDKDTPEENIIETINRQISKLGFYIYNLKALKDEKIYFSYDYDLFKDNMLIAPHLSEIHNFDFDRNRFIFKAEQRINFGEPPQYLLIDTGRVTEDKYYILHTLLKGKILSIVTTDSNKSGQIHYAVADGENILYDFYVDNYLGDVAVTSFFSKDNHWILEHYPNKVVIDGVESNKIKGYSDIINYRYLNKKLFYIFKDSLGKFKIFYDDSIYPNEYDKIMNNGCCSASALNPQNLADKVSFFATKNNNWYYVEAVLIYK